MSAYRGKSRRGYLYVHGRMGRKLRACGTTVPSVVKSMKRMLAELRARRQWDVLEPVVEGRLSLGALFDAWVANDLEGLRQRLASVDLVAYVEPWLADYLSNGKSARNAPIYRSQVQSFVEGWPSSHDLTPANVSAWLREANVSSGSKRNRLMALRSFVRYLVRMGVLSSNPIRDVETPRKNAPSMRYEAEAIDRAVVAAAPTVILAALFALVHGTGADLSPVIERTERRDIDLQRGVVRLRGTKHAKRHVHEAIIEPWALPAVEAHVRGMMPHVKPFAGLTRFQAAWHHKTAAKAAGAPGYTLRMARHSWAVRARQAGHSFEYIAEQLGNSVYQVATVYARFTLTTDERIGQHLATEQATTAPNGAGVKRA